MNIADKRTNITQPPTSRITAILLGLLVAIVYVPLAYIVAVLTGPEFSGGSYSLLFIYAIGAISVPVATWFRYGLRGPITVMVAVLGFWHVIVPIFGNEGDGTPVFALALATAPIYIVAYIIVGGIEYILRRRAGGNLLPT